MCLYKYLCVLVTLWFYSAMQKIEICLGQNCKPYGGQALADALEAQGVPVTTFECRSLCTYAPVVFVDDKAKLKATRDDLYI
jgi:NADH:ubiquinone oxidoreductase subunit E